ncbi:succinate dehydrogenase, cytochrome b556 subunit [Chloroherpeton thalassium ATCC 35110]|uniref:Succinate dehydrogenase cytochrome b556 subunit n=1 Tax=Chloroherpeton thalassium (strain ATCC 35110 / GB-78) TaxID=517418 RepID=B3QUM3_CHLT3|nr:succinate dehydrogenase, cytochrome b556 subunit [Chloroherpeton thalassium]ACF12929.1 succinate dehydrogenase, cytochrome b556 subunit [Chloroherpeton thalassium ATCC 35110]
MAEKEQEPRLAAKLKYKPSFPNALKSIFSYNWHGGMWAWLLHRASGIGLVVYLIIHINGLRSMYDPVKFDMAMSAYRSPLFKIGELVILALVAYHSINGFRIVMIDFLGWTPQQKRMFFATVALSIVIIALGGYPIVAPYFINTLGN